MNHLKAIIVISLLGFLISCKESSPTSNNDDPKDATPLMQNGGFESGSLEGWTPTGEAAAVSISNTEARTDTYCAMINGAGGLEQKITGLLPRTKYTVMGYVKLGTSTRLEVGVKDFTRKITETDYAEFKHTFVTGDTSTSAVVYFKNDRATGTVYSDDFSLVREAIPPAEGITSYAPPGYKWALIPTLSDEFNADFDTTKWQKNSSGWKGRKPGLFKESQVKVENGNLQITTDILPVGEQVDGWSHAGGLVGSVSPALPSWGGYYECRMKANKTFMSSTFWLINNKSEGTGCDNRTTELDIQECVGHVSSTAGWAQSFENAMHSNTHSRNTTCAETPDGSIGNNVPVGSMVWADYHTYGAWWKSPTEIIFYLDGKEVGTVTPAAEFSLPMYMRFVVETYDWNPVPPGGGMRGTEEERTTYYDWVRSSRLVPD